MVASYRCYFFGTASPFLGTTSSIERAENMDAETDEEARIKAEAMYGQQRNRAYGFELWQANRLVYRYQDPKADHQTDLPSNPDGKSCP